MKTEQGRGQVFLKLCPILAVSAIKTKETAVFQEKKKIFFKILLAMDFSTVEPQKNMLYIIAE